MNAKQLRDAALSLSRKDRADLAHDLLRSLDGPAEPEAEAAWLAELESRATNLAEGTVVPVDWEDARRRIRQRLHERRP